MISIFPGKLLSDQTAGHGLKGSQINIFSTEYRNKNYFLIENEDLTQLRHLRILNNGSFNESSSGVLKLLPTLLFTCYTKYTILLDTLNCKLCSNVKIMQM